MLRGFSGHRPWLRSLAALSIAWGVVLSGCSISPSPQSRNQIAQGVLGDPKTFNPALNNESPNIFGYVSEGLISENGKGEIEPALAESWQINGNSIKFTLRPNLKWSDGAPLTVDDVLFSYNEVYLNEDIPTDIRDVLRIGTAQKLPTVKKIGDRQVEFIMPESFAPALRTVGGISIMPAHKLRAAVKAKEAYRDAEGKTKYKSKFLSMWGVNTPPQELVSNGMYRLANYVPGERLVFERNPHYWRKDKQGQSQPYIERVVWQIVENTDAALMQFRSKNLDSYSVTPDFFSLLKQEEHKGGFKIHNVGPSSSMTFMAFNLNKGQRNGKPLVDPVKSRWFNNIQFRQAVAYALDRQRMINNIYRGLGAPQNSPISVGTPYYLPKGLKTYNYNLNESKKLLTAAGFKYKRDELFDDQGNRVRFTLITNSGNKIREALGTQIQQDLGKIGIKVDFSPIAFSLLVDKLDNALDWDAHIIGFGGGVEPNDSANFWLTGGRSHIFNQKPNPQQEPLTGQEIAPWEQQINDLYIKGAQELNEAKRREIYYQTQRITQENLPCIYLVNSLSLQAVSNRVKGIKPSTLYGTLWNLHELKIQE